MPDISMCSNNNCIKANRCYRFIAIPNPYRQSYGEFSQDPCEYFIDVRGDFNQTAFDLEDESEPFRG